jgi:hypothetical protein
MAAASGASITTTGGRAPAASPACCTARRSSPGVAAGTAGEQPASRQRTVEHESQQLLAPHDVGDRPVDDRAGHVDRRRVAADDSQRVVPERHGPPRRAVTGEQRGLVDRARRAAAMDAHGGRAQVDGDVAVEE